MLDLAEIAASQWGLVTTAQARATGSPPRKTWRGYTKAGWSGSLYGVYRVSGTPPSPLDDLRAAWLTLDPARTADQRLFDQPPAATPTICCPNP